MVLTRRRSARLLAATGDASEGVHEQIDAGAATRKKAPKRDVSNDRKSVDPPLKRGRKGKQVEKDEPLAKDEPKKLTKKAPLKKRGRKVVGKQTEEKKEQDQVGMKAEHEAVKPREDKEEAKEETGTSKEDDVGKDAGSDVEMFGNSSDGEAPDSDKKVKAVKSGALSSPAVPKKRAARRTAMNAIKKLSEKDAGDGSSSSSDSDSEESDAEKKDWQQADTKQESEESESDEEMMSDEKDDSDSDADFTEVTPQKGKKRAFTNKGASSSKQRPGSSASGRKVAPKKGGGARAPAAKKPPKPWQSTTAAKVGDIEVPAREMRKGEKKMLHFRMIADNLSIGRGLEMTMEESNKMVAEMHAAYAAKKQGKMAQMEAEPIEKERREDDSSDDEDEWEEFEPVDGLEGDKRVEVTIEPKQEYDWWALYLRQEVNKRIHENWENTHQVHLLCYIAHLQHLKKVVSDEHLVPSLILTQMPNGFMALIGEPMTLKNANKIASWFSSTFKVSPTPIVVPAENMSDVRFPETARFSVLANQKTFEMDYERASLLFALFLGMECICRLCVNVKPISRKWDEALLKSLAEKTVGKSRKDEQPPVKTKKSNSKAKSEKSETEERNYWVEFWHSKEKRWICIDPVSGTVDNAVEIEKTATRPVTYVFAIDNKGGIRDVTARYASDFVKPDFRRRRTNQAWIIQTFGRKSLRADRTRAQLEDVHFRTELVKRPLPTSMAEYKNHPLYVLEKDLLKFEAIHPPVSEQTPLGSVRGHNVYPRDTVYTLQSAKNWEKLARSVKEGEKASKVVKARVNPRIPVEKREEKTLDLFGFWQTEQYRREVVVNGRIPRNEFGNVYMYQAVMCPIGAVHLRLPGLPQIARRLKKECVGAVIGWDFHNCSNYPIIDGACVLEEDVDEFIAEWKKVEAGREEKEEQRREERVHANWRKLIRGIIRLHYVKARFGKVSHAKEKKAKGDGSVQALVNEPSTSSGIIDRTQHATRQEFTLEEMMQF